MQGRRPHLRCCKPWAATAALLSAYKNLSLTAETGPDFASYLHRCVIIDPCAPEIDRERERHRERDRRRGRERQRMCPLTCAHSLRLAVEHIEIPNVPAAPHRGVDHGLVAPAGCAMVNMRWLAVLLSCCLLLIERKETL